MTQKKVTTPLASISSGLGGGSGYSGAYGVSLTAAQTYSPTKASNGHAGNVTAGSSTGKSDRRVLVAIDSADGARRELDLRGEKPIVIQTDHGEIDMELLAVMFTEVKDLLCILREEKEKLDHYPALKAAYEEYRLIDAMVRPDDDEK